ncbi:unnamed protein product, partial [Brassica rapa subsp. narinosa]
KSTELKTKILIFLASLEPTRRSLRLKKIKSPCIGKESSNREEHPEKEETKAIDEPDGVHESQALSLAHIKTLAANSMY